MTVEQLYRSIASRLVATLGQSEGTAAARMIFEDVRGMSATDIIVNGHRSLEDFTVKRIDDIVASVEAGIPVQYAIGSARFAGIDLKVTPDVLIPRPETAQLVDMIIDRHREQSDLHILDCGTGSGCIAITLARGLHFADIDAIDISAKALDVARQNAANLKVKINFSHVDILQLDSRDDVESYDIIVSNPPYILPSEADEMDTRVKAHEPTQALFVDAADPIVFYRAIAKYGVDTLRHGGMLYFEINPLCADLMRRMLVGLGYNDVDIIRDYKGNYRFAIARK